MRPLRLEVSKCTSDLTIGGKAVAKASSHTSKFNQAIGKIELDFGAVKIKEVTDESDYR